MSSGGVVLAPLAAPIIIGAGVIVAGAIAVGAAGFLMARAASAATQKLADGAERLGEAMEEEARGQEDAARSSRLWEIAAQEVVGLNARLRVLGEQAKTMGSSVAIPAPYDMANQTLPRIRQWCQDIDERLREIREYLDLAMADQDRSQLAASLVGLTSAEEILAKHQAILRQRHHATTSKSPVPPKDSTAKITAEVERILLRLDPDASSDERTCVLQAAANVSRQSSVGSARTYLMELQHRVDSQVNPAVARRRLAATWLQTVEAAIATGEPNPPFPQVTQRLLRVVRAEADLDPALRAEALACVRWAEDVAYRRFVQSIVHSCLLEQGYSLTEDVENVEGVEVSGSAGLRVSRSDWGQGHCADIWVDGAGVVEGRVLRRVDAEGANADAIDAERCVEFSDDIERLAHTLRTRGVDATVRHDSGRPVQRTQAQGQWRHDEISHVAPQVRHKGNGGTQR